MPYYGPGTKLVLKGLARAFPEIAEQRAREKQEERDQLQSSKRKQTSRHGDGEDQHRPSTYPEVGRQDGRQDGRSRTHGHSRHGSSNHSHIAGDFESEGDNRPESVGRRPSGHRNTEDAGYHGRSRGHSRVESDGRGPSMHINTRDSRGQSQYAGHSRAESIRRAHSNRSHASSPSSTRPSRRGRGESLSAVEEEFPIRRG